MSTFASILSPVGGSTASAATADVSASLGATTSTAEIVLGPFNAFAINATGDINIRFGNAGMPAAAATDFRIPSGTIATYPTNRQHDRIRIFNPGGAGINFWIQPMTAAG